MDWPGGTQPGAAQVRSSWMLGKTTCSGNGKLAQGRKFRATPQVALWHYRKCKAGHGMYIGVYFNAIAEDAVGYEPTGCTMMHLL